jgi:hypothetical protein
VRSIPHDHPSEDRAGSQFLVGALFFCLLGLHVVAILALPVFPNQDGPVHLYYAQVAGDLETGSDPYGGLFQIREGLPPYAVHSYLLTALSRWTSPVWAEKVLAAGQVLLLGLGFRYLAGGLCGSGLWAALLVIPLLFHRFLLLGFQSYSLALGVLLFLCGFWVRHNRNLGAKHLVVCSGLLAALLLTHPTGLLVALVFGLIHGTAVLLGENRPSGFRDALKRGWPQALLPVTAGSMLLYASRFAADREVRHFEWNIERLLFQFQRLYNQEPTAPLYTGALWWITSLVLLAGVIAALFALKFPRPGTGRIGQMSVFATGFAAFIAFLFLPDSVGQAHYFAVRFVLVGYLFLLASVSALRVPDRMKLPIALCLAASGTVCLSQQMDSMTHWAEQARPLLEAPRMKPGAVGAIISDGEFYERVLPLYHWYSPCQWAPAHYFTRSRATLLNTPWRRIPWVSVTSNDDRPYLGLDGPPLGRRFGEAFSGQQAELPDKLDFIIGVDCRPGPPDTTLFEQVAEKYGLQRPHWSTSSFFFYIDPAELAPN